ncbi:glycosyltransferase family protein [Dongia deserti]|uniref:glycosyltransferase family protein n=1 Tax=Dongia deserti TaxID=2268030 RepID=UPI000E649C41|nr:glycosyltransferase [Dongia deserti]
MTAPRVFFYVQHLLGIGHLKRAAAIARALVEAGATVDFVLGGAPVSGIAPAGARVVQLPPAIASDAQFTNLLDERGNKVDERWKVKRKQALLDAFEESRPDIVLLEMYPFGRRQFRFELLPLLDSVGAQFPKPVVAVSVRDILVDKGRMDRAREAVDIVNKHVDLVLVHGDPALTRLDLTFPLASEIADKTVYTGFVVERPIVVDSFADRADGEILVSAGGGAVGFPLLSATIRAKKLTRHRHRVWRIVTGANLPAEERKELDRLAFGDPDIVIEGFRADFASLLTTCQLSVSQGGYNTVMELIATQCPAVIVPFAEGGESEQTMRGRMLMERAVLSMVDPEFLTGGTLAAAIDAVRPPAALELNLDGARQSAAELIAGWKKRQ